MKESFLEYTKYILERVSFDLELLKKEYHKALKMLEREEVISLNSWILSKGYKLQSIAI
tara:strand:+ start:192 stop:368 length:177 start_codon:yes stop_codon:yes gene_type:complete